MRVKKIMNWRREHRREALTQCLVKHNRWSVLVCTEVFWALLPLPSGLKSEHRAPTAFRWLYHSKTIYFNGLNFLVRDPWFWPPWICLTHLPNRLSKELWNSLAKSWVRRKYPRVCILGLLLSFRYTVLTVRALFLHYHLTPMRILLPKAVTK